MQCESLLERDFCLLTEVDPAVIRYWEQPHTVAIHVDGKICRHTLDFYVERRDDERVRRTMTAVRPAGKVFLADPAERALVAAYFEAVREAVEREGCTFRLVTEREIRVEPRLHNAKLILRGCSPLEDRDALFAVRAAVLRLGGPTTIGEMREALPGLDAFSALMRLLWAGEVRADMGRRIDDHTTIERT